MAGELKEEAKPGLYKLRDGSSRALFMITGEVSSIYKQGDKVRRVHNMILVPNFRAADGIIKGLEKVGANLRADGRPIMGVHCDDLVKIVKDASASTEVIPAHAWTPHFGVFGSLSGFNTVEEAFGDQAKHIFAIETGLSSDPKMNWQISGLDKYSLVSNSDAHSLRKIGREANVFEINGDKLSCAEIIRIVKLKIPQISIHHRIFRKKGNITLMATGIVSFPASPSKPKIKGVCPVCGKNYWLGFESGR